MAAMNAITKVISPDKLIAAFAETPEVRAALEASEKRRVVEHAKHAAALASLDKTAEAAFLTHQSEIAAAIARRDEAWRAYQEAQTDVTRLAAKHSGDS